MSASSHRTDELDHCFGSLQQASDAGHRDVEDAIWAIWCEHADPEATAAMITGIGSLSRGELEAARVAFDALVALHPDWAEVWNKRATVRFLLGDDTGSVEDIEATLTREPRHFGALGGLIQIALRNGNPDAALIALERLKQVNPGAPGADELESELRARALKTLH